MGISRCFAGGKARCNERLGVVPLHGCALDFPAGQRQAVHNRAAQGQIPGIAGGEIGQQHLATFPKMGQGSGQRQRPVRLPAFLVKKAEYGAGCTFKLFAVAFCYYALA